MNKKGEVPLSEFIFCLFAMTAPCRYPYVACEVLSCEVWSIVEAVIENVDLLSNFWQFLDRPSPLNPLQASYFHKVIAMFLTKKTSEV